MRQNSLRLEEFDYSRCGAYFVTLVARQRECLFGQVEEGAVRLSPVGRVVWYTWRDLPRHFSYLHLDGFVVMPNHLHGILIFDEHGDRGGEIERKAEEPGQPPRGPAPGSLGAVIGWYKSEVTRRVANLISINSIWQRNYHDRIIRNEQQWEQIRKYILFNPMMWEEDQINPARRSRRNG